MAMIENRPRSATARFLEASTVEVIGREDFQKILVGRGEQLLPYLTTIFDRLRVTNDRLLAALAQLDQLEPTSRRRRQEIFSAAQCSVSVQIDPDTDEMSQQTALQSRVVNCFPFQFGRRSSSPGLRRSSRISYL